MPSSAFVYPASLAFPTTSWLGHLAFLERSSGEETAGTITTHEPDTLHTSHAHTHETKAYGPPHLTLRGVLENSVGVVVCDCSTRGVDQSQPGQQPRRATRAQSAPPQSVAPARAPLGVPPANRAPQPPPGPPARIQPQRQPRRRVQLRLASSTHSQRRRYEPQHVYPDQAGVNTGRANDVPPRSHSTGRETGHCDSCG